ncbi:MAG: hypothetical protein ABIK85_04360, partial [Candidatus Eisenbacteria bacterium]
MRSDSIERFIPSTVYETVAYFGSGSLFVLLGSMALLERSLISSSVSFLFGLDLPEQLGLLAFASMITYAYGQLSSTLSAPFVAKPVGRFVRTFGGRGSDDFRISFADAVRGYGLAEHLPEGKVNNKWTLMFYLQTSVPDIGKDIMKRYAREKMARINAFNMLALIVLSLLSYFGARLDFGARLGL